MYVQLAAQTLRHSLFDRGPALATCWHAMLSRHSSEVCARTRLPSVCCAPARCMWASDERTRWVVAFSALMSPEANIPHKADEADGFLESKVERHWLVAI